MSEGNQDQKNEILNSVLEKMRRLGYSELLDNAQVRNDAISSAMTDYGDDVTSEMGEQLQDGKMSWRDVFLVPEYREVIESGLESVQTINIEELLDECDGLIEVHGMGPEGENYPDRPLGAIGGLDVQVRSACEQPLEK